MVTIREACEADIDALKHRLREADEKEVIATDENPEQALRESYARSRLRYCVDIDGIPCGLFGLVPDENNADSARAWFLGAPEMSKIKKTFVTLSRYFVNIFLGYYPQVWNIVDLRYVASVKWLNHLGVDWGDTAEIKGVPFRAFRFRRT